MERKLNEFLCGECGVSLVIENRHGNLEWGHHEWWCPARYPEKDGPARRAAMDKLVCGDACQHPNTNISDLGEIAICAKCPNENLARAATDAHVKASGGKKRVEVVLPAPRRRVPHVPLPLYTDALVRIDELEKKLKRRSQ